MQDFRRLQVWARAHALGLEIYQETFRWPRGHGALASQTRRAAMSIAANITEGCGQDGATEFARYLNVSLATAAEADHHLQCAADLALIDRRLHAGWRAELTEIRRMLAVLRQRVLERRR